MVARILIIEDERLLSRALVEALHGVQYSAIPVYTGLEGFARL
jgi:DNA-binding response OmpR family regulator